MPFCTLKVLASDRGRPSCQTVHILTVNILDDDDVAASWLLPPDVWFNVSFSLEDSTSPGTIVGSIKLPRVVSGISRRVNAFIEMELLAQENRTIEANNGTWSPPIVYRVVSGNVLDTFGVDGSSGMLYVARPINHVACSTYRLHIEAIVSDDVVDSDNRIGDIIDAGFEDSSLMPFARILVTINVTSAKDGNPPFDLTPTSSNLVSLAVREDVPVGSVVFIAATAFSGSKNFSKRQWYYVIESQYCSPRRRRAAGDIIGDDVECDVFAADRQSSHVTLVSGLDADHGQHERIIVVIAVRRENIDIDSSSPGERQVVQLQQLMS